MIEVIGFVAGVLTALAFLPQVVRTWRTRSANDLSVVMLGLQSTGVALWIVYGVGMRAWPVILANVCTLVQSLALLVFTRLFRHD